MPEDPIDPAENDKDTNSLLLDRRSYLGAAASAVAAVCSVGASGGAAAQAEGDYEVIEVAAGETYEVQLGDGETLEDVLIDITADDARYQITATGSDWAIRNVGVRGTWDTTEKLEPIVLAVDEGSTGVVENLYLGDGAHDDEYPGVTGIFVTRQGHQGTLKINRVNIQDFPDNAIYASSPGYEQPDKNGGGGEVHITDSYAAGCRAANFRLGTTGSYLENCVTAGGDRGIWAYFQHIEVRNCDFSDAQFGDVYAGGTTWENNADAEVTATDSRWENTALSTSTNELHGESVGPVQRTEPGDVEGVPLTAEEAASGGNDTSSPTPENADEEAVGGGEEVRDQAAIGLASTGP